MSALETWRSHAKEFRGSIVIWINQADEGSTVMQANAEGVCHAIASDWLLACRTYLSERSDFVNAFRAYDERARLKEYSIPKKYLDQQTELGQVMKLRQAERADLFKEYKRAKEADDKGSTSNTKIGLKLAESAIKQHDRSIIGAADCIAFGQFKALDKLNDFMARLKKPGYWAVVLRGDPKDNPHTVAFEFRPDKSAGGFPGIYEFIDANTGLVVFGTSDEMLGFVKKYVWPMYPDYTLYDLYGYGIGYGGFGEASDEVVKELEELVDDGSGNRN